MRTRAAAVLAVAALALGLATAILAGIGYASVVDARAAVPVARVLHIWESVEPDPTLPGYPALPDAKHLPEYFTAQQREDALIWLEQKEYVAECMAEAGFPGYRYFARWQPGAFSGAQLVWQDGFSDAERMRANDTLNGTDPAMGTGVDYRWERSGCEGYAWHKVGIDYPVVY